MHLTCNRQISLSSIRFFSAPFQYFVSREAFDDASSLSILEWLETSAPWRLVETEFYEQFEFNFSDVRLPHLLSFLQEQSFLDDLRAKVERLFDITLCNRIDLNAHKLLSGQRIRIHNDFIPGQETHRLLIQLNREWSDENGGLLIFFNSPDPADMYSVFRPIHNSMIGFAISHKSHHAVSTIHNGERYTLVYSFYEKQ